MGDNDELHGFVSEYETESDDTTQNGGRNSRIKIIKCIGYIVLIALIVGIGYITYDKDNLIKYIERKYGDKSNNTVYGIILLGEYGCVPNYTNNSNTDMDMDILFNFSCVFGDTLINPMNLIHTINNTIKYDNSNDIDLFKYNSDNNIVFEFEMIYDKFKYNVLYGNVTNGDNLNIIGVNSITMTNIHNPSYKYILHDNIDYAYVTISHMDPNFEPIGISSRNLAAADGVPSETDSVSSKPDSVSPGSLSGEVSVSATLFDTKTGKAIFDAINSEPLMQSQIGHDTYLCQAVIQSFQNHYYYFKKTKDKSPTKTCTPKTTMYQSMTHMGDFWGPKGPMAQQIGFLREKCGKDQNAMASGRKCWGELGQDLANKVDIEKHVADFIKIAEEMAKDEVNAEKLKEQEDAIEAVIHSKADELKTVVKQESIALEDEHKHANELKVKSEAKSNEAQQNKEAAQLTAEANKALTALQGSMRQGATNAKATAATASTST